MTPLCCGGGRRACGHASAVMPIPWANGRGVGTGGPPPRGMGVGALGGVLGPGAMPTIVAECTAIADRAAPDAGMVVVEIQPWRPRVPHGVAVATARGDCDGCTTTAGTGAPGTLMPRLMCPSIAVSAAVTGADSIAATRTRGAPENASLPLGDSPVEPTATELILVAASAAVDDLLTPPLATPDKWKEELSLADDWCRAGHGQLAGGFDMEVGKRTWLELDMNLPGLWLSARMTDEALLPPRCCSLPGDTNTRASAGGLGNTSAEAVSNEQPARGAC